MSTRAIADKEEREAALLCVAQEVHNLSGKCCAGAIVVRRTVTHITSTPAHNDGRIKA